jgi:quercetin dioxygenase-like cupin family protein
MKQFVPVRRVVTGVGEDGRSRIVIDGPVPRYNDLGAAYAWRTDSLPADNAGTEDTAVPYEIGQLHHPGSTFAVVEFAPGTQPYMHVTDTLDYGVILSGSVALELESGEVRLGPGDFLVNRGVRHGWRNDGDEPCVLAFVYFPSEPVGPGRTI